MAFNMAAILQINARTSGTDQLREMDRSLRRIGSGAESSVGGVQRLSQATRVMGSIAGTIGLAALTAQMVAYGRSALQAGDDMNLLQQRLQFAATSVGEVNRVMALATEGGRRYALSQFEATEAITNMYAKLKPMGVGLNETKDMFIGVNNAARMSGASIDDVREVMRQLGQGIGQTALNGEELKTIMERMPPLGAAIATAFNNIARSKGLTLITRQRADDLVAEVRDGEKRQTRVLEEEGRNRVRAAEKESEEMLREIADRYEKEYRLLNDKYDDQDDLERDRKDKERKKNTEAINERYDAVKESNEEVYNEKLKAIQKDERLSEEAKERARKELDEERKYYDKQVRKNEEADMEKIEDKYKKEEKIRQRQARDQREKEEAALKEKQRAEEEATRDYAERRKVALEQNNKDELEANKKMANELVKGIQDRTIKTVGDLKKLGAELKITPDVIFAAMKELSKMEIPPPTDLQGLTAAIKDMNTEIGEKLLPILKPFIVELTSLLRGFNGLPEPVKATAVGLGLVATALTAVGTAAIAAGGVIGVIKGMRQAAAGPVMPAPVLPGGAPIPEPPKGMWKGFMGEVRAAGGAIRGLGAAFAATRIAAVIAGWAGAIGPAVATITAALSGLLAWVGATLVPGLLAFFSGPVGWITLAVAAVVAGVILFREPIMEFFSWIGETVGGWAQGFMGLVSDVVIKPLIRLWDSVKQPVSNLFTNISWLAGEAFKAVLALGYELFLDPWVELWEIIKGPAVAVFDGLASLAETAFNRLVSIGYAIFIEPWTALWSAIKQPAVDTYKFLSIELEAVFNALVQLGYDLFIKPWTDLWAAIKKPAEDTFKAVAKIAQNIFNGIIKWIYDKFLKPWVETWNFLTQEPKKFKENVGKMIEDTLNDLNRKFSNLASWLTTPFAVAGNAIKSIFNSVLGSAAGSFNQIAAQINRLLVNVNNAARQLKLPEVAYLEAIQYTSLEADKIAPPTLAKVAAPQPPAPKPTAEIKLPELDYKDIPAMARGGWVARPTIAQIGDTGRAGGEYAIPAEMMPAAMAAWNQGARGDALVSAMRSGGLAPGSSLGGSSGGGGGRAQLNLSIQTGPVLQQPDGSQWVQREELVAVAEAVFTAAVEAGNSSAARSMSGWS